MPRPRDSGGDQPQIEEVASSLAARVLVDVVSRLEETEARSIADYKCPKTFGCGEFKCTTEVQCPTEFKCHFTFSTTRLSRD